MNLMPKISKKNPQVIGIYKIIGYQILKGRNFITHFMKECGIMHNSPWCLLIIGH